MQLDPTVRTRLLDAILAALREAVPGSEAVLRGSLAEGQADQRDRSYDLENPAARGADWSLAESALMNAVAAVKAHLRGDDRGARELLGRGYQQLGLEMPEQPLTDQILELAGQAARLDHHVVGLARRIRALAAEYIRQAEGDVD